MFRLPAVSHTFEKPIIGILGGICSGKSTVASEFAKLGCKVIDADRIAHQLLEQTPIRKKIIDSFGSSVLGSSGKIDRRKLADMIFSDGKRISQLNSIIHPVVLQRVEQLIEEYKKEPQIKAIVLDMPLLMEVNWQKRCDKLIFVACNRAKRLKRAKKMGLFDENQFKVRENFQIFLDNKAGIADNTINNNSDFLALAKQVLVVFSNIMDNK
ncbi:dephospho-CoA kinase [Planctomycetota bacterium]